MNKLRIATMAFILTLGLLSAVLPIVAQAAEVHMLDWPSEARYVSMMSPSQAATSQTLEQVAVEWPNEARFVLPVVAVQDTTPQTMGQIALSWPSEARFGSTVEVALTQ